MGRASWKLKFFSNQFYRLINFFFFLSFIKFDKNKIKLFKTYFSIPNNFIFNKSSSLPLIFLKKIFFFKKCDHTVKLLIKRNNVGYKVGEFIFTRKPFFFISKIKKKKNKR